MTEAAHPTVAGPRPAQPAPPRYVALDGMRGWLSLGVALAHLRFYGNYYDSELLYCMYMMIDYFFVLSGLVIAQSSLDRLNNWSQFSTYMIRRIGRVYPMHALLLTAYFTLELLKYLVSRGNSATPAFTAPFTLASLPGNFLLLQGWNLFDTPTWNMPAWSVSTEFYVYVLFALLVLFVGKKRLPYLAPLLILGSTLTLYFNVQNGDVTYKWGWARCIAGFYCGYLMFLFDRATREQVRAKIPRAVFSVLELATMIGLGYFMLWAGRNRWALLAPYIFMYATWLFSFEAGVLSKVLMTRPLVALGEISFTTYIIHDFVWTQLDRALHVVQKLTGIPMFVVHGTYDDGSPAQLFSIASPAMMDVLAFAALGMLAAISWVINRRIETPILQWFQDLARKRDREARARAAAALPTQEVPAA